VPAGPEDRERVALAARHPRRVDAAAVSALADVLAATRRLEDQIGSIAVLPGVRGNCALARNLLADARPSIRDQVGSLAGELHQYLGWLLAETGHTEQARAEFDAALALGLEIDNPDLTSLALSFKGHLAWMLDVTPNGPRSSPWPPPRRSPPPGRLSAPLLTHARHWPCARYQVDAARPRTAPCPNPDAGMPGPPIRSCANWETRYARSAVPAPPRLEEPD
jgi:hypothetical protein